MNKRVFTEVFKAHCREYHETWTDYDIDKETIVMWEAAKKLQQARVSKSFCHVPMSNCQRFLNHGFVVCKECEHYY